VQTTKLTPRQAKFVQEYLVDGNGTQAAIRSGAAAAGAHVWASRALKDPKVQKAMQALQSADAARLHIKRENVVAALLEAVETAREQKEPMAMIRGLAELGKMMGFSAPRQIEVKPVDKELATMNQMSKMTDSELMALISAAATL
jgi:phage terminase small subunit